MMLFFDRTFGHRLPDALCLLGLAAEKHDAYFSQDTSDEEWLAEVGRRGWAVFTSDKRMARNQMALSAIADHSVGCFILCGAGHRPRWFGVRILARNWESIERLVEGEERPFLCRLYIRQPPKSVGLPGFT